jgi:hypothetical protein
VARMSTYETIMAALTLIGIVIALIELTRKQ